jgi:hypothetical protein
MSETREIPITKYKSYNFKDLTYNPETQTVKQKEKELPWKIFTEKRKTKKGEIKEYKTTRTTVIDTEGGRRRIFKSTFLNFANGQCVQHNDSDEIKKEEEE